ncbi:MAG: hypothetical protein HC888_02345 [Candidatus Competibacteraceae bacterium]|nr:hypothetical protein [Candidatus Competibacteraceae bacterium]
MKVIESEGFKKLAQSDLNTIISLDPSADDLGLGSQLFAPMYQKRKKKKRKGRQSPTDEVMPKGML